MQKLIIILFSFYLASPVFAQPRSYDVNTFLKDQEIQSIMIDSLSRLYIQAKDTSYYFDNKNFLQVDEVPIGDNSLLTDIEVKLKSNTEIVIAGALKSAAQLKDGRIIFTDESGKLYQLYNSKFQRYLIPDFEPENTIINKLIASGDLLIVCTLNDGVYIWRPKEFRLDKINSMAGLADNNIRDALLDDWGNLWLATDWGLKHLQYLDHSASSVPDVFVEHMNVLYESRIPDFESEVLLKKTENNLQFHFESVDYSEGSTINYEYRFRDAAPWTATQEKLVSKTNLEPGSYAFQVRATNGNGHYGYTQPVKFKIESSLTDTIWPLVLGGLGLLTLAWLWSLVRYNRSTKEFQKEKKKLVLENQLLKSEQKRLQLQMNPHFIFNALSSIQGLIVTKENTKARNSITKLASLMRGMLSQSRDESITLKDEIKYLNDYLSIEQMSRGDKFDFGVDCSEALHQIEIPSMLVQPFVENAVVHGMKGLKRRGQIKVSFEKNSDGVHCVVEDNGVGRSSMKKEDHKSVALQVVKERLEKYNGLRSRKTYLIEDLKYKTGESAGTKIELQLPIL